MPPHGIILVGLPLRGGIEKTEGKGINEGVFLPLRHSLSRLVLFGIEVDCALG